MQMKRKLQLGSVAVALSGIWSLGLLSPTVALANPCSPINTCYGSNHTVCESGGAAYCQSIAPSGCTVTSFTCQPTAECNVFPQKPSGITCNFN